MNKDLKNFLLLLLLACCWGPSFLFMKVAVSEIPPITITASRLLIGGILLFLIVKFRKITLPKPDKSWWHLFAAGMLQSAVPFTLFAAGEQYVDSSLAAMISGSSPLFTLILAHLFTQNDRITKNKLIGSCIGFVGLFLLVFASPHSSKVETNILGVVMILLAALCYSTAFVYTKKYIHGFAPMTAPTIQMFFGFACLLPLSLLVDKPYLLEYVSHASIISVVGLGVFGTAMAFTIYYKMLENVSSTYLSMVNYMTPVFGAGLGVLVLGEKLFWNSYVGCLMILLGVMIAGGLIKISFNHKFLKKSAQ